MKLFLNNKEVTISELKSALDNLDPGPADGGTFEIMALDDINEDGDMFFEINGYSTF